MQILLGVEGWGSGGNKLEVDSGKSNFWKRIGKQMIDFRLGFLQEQALFVRERIRGTDVYIHPKEVSRKSIFGK